MPGVTWVTMTATKAKDAYGGPIQYYFQELNPGGIPTGVVQDWNSVRTFQRFDLKINDVCGYRVKARDARGNETAWSVIGVAKVGFQSPPTAPINLNAVAVSNAQINLSWTDTSSDELGFKIERRTGANPTWVPIATIAVPNTTQFNNTGLTAATQYTYRVYAYNAGGNSVPSNEASATTLGGGGGGGTPIEPNILSVGFDPNCSQTLEADPNTGIMYWFHTVVGEIPDLGGANPVWFRFVCTDTSVFTSRWISDAETFPLNLPHPVSSTYPAVVVTINGNVVTYRIAVKQGGAFGWSLGWKVCASFNADGSNSSCSPILRIPWH